MKRQSLLRVALVLVLLASAAAIQAAPLEPVTASAYRFTTSSTQSYVDIVVSNHNSFNVGVVLNLQLELPNGVSRTVNGSTVVPPGNSTSRFVLPFEIKSVRFLRVTGVYI